MGKILIIRDMLSSIELLKLRERSLLLLRARLLFEKKNKNLVVKDATQF
jgi:hypothetical protein